MKVLFLFVLLFISVSIMFLSSGCATEYYPPHIWQKQGAVKRKGFVPWSDGVGKSFLNPSFNVVGK